jgi:predicted nucleic acid-binding protein
VTRSFVGSAVFDASVFVRAVVDDDERAQRWLHAAASREVRLEVPDLVWSETANAMKLAVAAGKVRDDVARDAVAAIARFPARVRRMQDLVPAAFARALELPLTVYDACYLVLARLPRRRS